SHAELTRGVYQNWNRVHDTRCHPTNPPDKALFLMECVSDGANANAGDEGVVVVTEDVFADIDIPIFQDITPSSITDGRVELTCEVLRKGSLPQGHVEATAGVEDEGIFSYRSVEAAGVIVQECLTTHRRVATATGVRPERLKAESRVERARGKAEEGIKSLSGVEAVIESIRCRRRQKLR